MKRLLCLLTGLAVTFALRYEVDNDARLPVVGSAENFIKLMAQQQADNHVRYGPSRIWPRPGICRRHSLSFSTNGCGGHR